MWKREETVEFVRLDLEVVMPFISERLARGHTLCQLVLKRVDFSQGKVISTLPEEVGAHVAGSGIQWGGKMPSPWPEVRGYHIYPDGRKVPLLRDSRAPVHSMVCDFLGHHEHGLYVIEDHVSKASDPLNHPNRPAHLALFGDEVYYILTASDAEDREKLSRAISWNYYPPLTLSVLTSLEEGEELPPDHGQFEQNQLEDFATRTEAVMIGAYDGEGHIVWTRSFGDRWMSF